jgi:hypothetical protein
MTVEPELYSITVFVLPCSTQSDNSPIASGHQQAKVDMTMMLLTWQCLHVVGRQHGHHFGVNPNTIFSVWVKHIRNFHKRQWWLTVRVEVLSQRIRAGIDVQWIDRRHCVGGEAGKSVACTALQAWSIDARLISRSSSWQRFPDFGLPSTSTCCCAKTGTGIRPEHSCKTLEI